MSIYRFRILNKLHSVIAGQYSFCADDDAARRHDDILSAETHDSDIEIWHEQQQVPRKRPDAVTLADDGRARSSGWRPYRRRGRKSVRSLSVPDPQAQGQARPRGITRRRGCSGPNFYSDVEV